MIMDFFLDDFCLSINMNNLPSEKIRQCKRTVLFNFLTDIFDY